MLFAQELECSVVVGGYKNWLNIYMKLRFMVARNVC